MNWKDYLNLFANGNFEIQNDSSDNVIKGKLVGVIKDRLFFGNLPFERIFKHCKLIARPISDMSIKEWESHYDLMISFGGDDSETPESFLYLLSIGVLPEAFDDTDIIWRYDNK